MRIVKGLISAVDWINSWVQRTVSLLILVMAGITLLEVIARFVFNRPTLWVHETTAQMFGAYFILGGGYVLLSRSHIRVDVFWSRLSPRKRAIADLATSVFAFLFLVVLLIYGGKMAWGSLQILEHSSTAFRPIVYPLRMVLVLGTSLFLLQLVVKFIRDLHMAVKGKEIV